MTLAEYLDGMRVATTAEALEAATQGPYKHAFRGPTWTRICKVRIEAGQRIVSGHPLGCYVPQLGPRRRLTLHGEQYRVGVGYNGAGVRYVWHSAGEWAMSLLRDLGFSTRAAHRIWGGGWNDYPHRVLAIVEDALAGRIPDPQLNALISHEREGGNPLRYTVEQNDADEHDRRATRPCACGGTLFDWGGGFRDGFSFINWHCNGCPDVFTEYMTHAQHRALRTEGRVAIVGDVG